MENARIATQQEASLRTRLDAAVKSLRANGWTKSNLDSFFDCYHYLEDMVEAAERQVSAIGEAEEAAQDNTVAKMAQVVQDWRAAAERWEQDYRTLQFKTEKMAELLAVIADGYDEEADAIDQRKRRATLDAMKQAKALTAGEAK